MSSHDDDFMDMFDMVLPESVSPAPSVPSAKSSADPNITPVRTPPKMPEPPKSLNQTNTSDKTSANQSSIGSIKNIVPKRAESSTPPSNTTFPSNVFRSNSTTTTSAAPIVRPSNPPKKPLDSDDDDDSSGDSSPPSVDSDSDDDAQQKPQKQHLEQELAHYVRELHTGLVDGLVAVLEQRLQDEIQTLKAGVEKYRTWSTKIDNRRKRKRSMSDDAGRMRKQ